MTKKIFEELVKRTKRQSEEIVFIEKLISKKITNEEIPVEIECHDCNFHGNAIVDEKDHYAPMIQCPDCDSYSIEILNGKDIVVKNIVIEKPDDD